MFLTNENSICACLSFLQVSSWPLSQAERGCGGGFTNELQASGAYSDGGGTRVGHKEDGFKEQIIRPLGAVINCKMALKDSTETITREGQMGVMVNN